MVDNNIIKNMECSQRGRLNTTEADIGNAKPVNPSKQTIVAVSADVRRTHELAKLRLSISRLARKLRWLKSGLHITDDTSTSSDEHIYISNEHQSLNNRWKHARQSRASANDIRKKSSDLKQHLENLVSGLDGVECTGEDHSLLKRAQQLKTMAQDHHCQKIREEQTLQKELIHHQYKRAEADVFDWLQKMSKRPVRSLDHIVLAAKYVYTMWKKSPLVCDANNLQVHQKDSMHKLDIAIHLREKILGKTGSRSDKGHKHMIYILKKCRAYLRLCNKPGRPKK